MLFRKIDLMLKQKWHLFYRIFHSGKNKFAVQAAVEGMRLLAYRQILLLNKILRFIKKMPKNGMTIAAEKEVQKAVIVLKKEKSLLSKANLQKLIAKDYNLVLDSIETEMLELLNVEVKIWENIAALASSVKVEKKKVFIKLNNAQKEQLSKALFELNRNITQLKQAVEKRKEVQATAKILLKQLARIQHTEMYGFMKDDFTRIKREADKIAENPSQANIKNILGGLYLIAPFSFDATGAVVFLRYALKYANSKSKGVRRRIKLITEKRKRHLKVF